MDVAQEVPLGSVLPWDRRVRVFVSSTLEELAAERNAVKEAIERLRLTPVMFELGARAHPPRELYTSYLRQSDVFLGLYGESYGWVGPGASISGLEDEYLLAADHPRLLYVKTPAPGRDPRLQQLIERIWTTSGVSTAPFRDADELGARVADDLAVLLTERFRSPAAGTNGYALGLHPQPLPHPAGPLVGRVVERDRLVDLLTAEEPRIVTLLGPGGIGKTRLALAVAEATRPQMAAACFVDLTAIREPEGVITAVGAALGLQPSPRPTFDVLVDQLGDQRVLVVLDNMEHLLAAARRVGELLAVCPGLRVLVTSRAALRLHGEQQVTVEALPEADARELFAHRARLVREGFEIDGTNLETATLLLRRLEGIPLAIELAAARLRLLPLDRLLPSPGGELDLATGDVDVPDRQRTLRATIVWSYDLLEADDKRLARCLAVLAPTWTLAAAEAVAGAGALDGLARLVDHSLISVHPDSTGEPRFRMLRTLRTFLLEQLHKAGDHEDAVQRLTSYVLRLAQDAEGGLRSGASRSWRARLDAEIETVRTVLDLAVEADDAELAVRVASALTWYWWSRGLLVEMLRRAETVAELPSAASLPPDLANVLLWCRGTIRIATGALEDARPLVERLLTDARTRQDGRVRALALFSASLLVPPSVDPSPETLLEEAVRLFEEHDDRW